MITFSAYYLSGLAVCFLIWLPSAQGNLGLFKSQVFNALAAHETSHSFEMLAAGVRLSIKCGFVLFYAPLTVFLVICILRNILSEQRAGKQPFYCWQFAAFVAIFIFLLWASPERHNYLAAFYGFYIFVGGLSLVKMLENSKNILIKKSLILLLYLCLAVACMPFLKTTLILPLTWNKADTYECNRRLIIQNIPKGSAVLTSNSFWYMLNKDYEVYDALFGASNISVCDYVLLDANGSGKPNKSNRVGHISIPYFQSHFKEQFSTLSDEPNQLFGRPISRSRWSYRFALFKRIK